jgi:hypothetical protein
MPVLRCADDGDPWDAGAEQLGSQIGTLEHVLEVRSGYAVRLSLR